MLFRKHRECWYEKKIIEIRLSVSWPSSRSYKMYGWQILRKKINIGWWRTVEKFRKYIISFVFYQRTKPSIFLKHQILQPSNRLNDHKLRLAILRNRRAENIDLYIVISKFVSEKRKSFQANEERIWRGFPSD